jgi:diguanylate cyclase (GGDEF)-like protein
VISLLSAVILVLADFSSLPAAARQSTFWLLAVLAVLAATRSFVTSGGRGIPVVISLSLCFTFAILLRWGLAAAIVTQVGVGAVVAWRLRRSVTQALAVGGTMFLSFGAAYLVLMIGHSDPLSRGDTIGTALNEIQVAGAAATWLVAYTLLALLTARLQSGARWHEATATLGFQTLYKAALLLLSPMLALAAEVSAGFIPLIFVPLFAVERMARLSGAHEYAARLDPLTGLANRAGAQARFDDLARAHGALTDPAQAGPRLALLLLDLDRFKHVNDTLGHNVGDELLAAVARRLSAAVGPAGTVARLGGDEFAVLAAGLCDVKLAEELAARITATLAEPVRLDDLHIDVTASIGIAIWPEHGVDFATLMSHADVAMYDAKRRGDTCAVYRPEADHNSPERLNLLTDLRTALQATESDEIAMHYQPQVALDTGVVGGVEALLRWRHPQRGLVDTQELLHIAEHTTAMHLITTRVIDEVLAQVAQWRAAGVDLRVSLNVSARDLYGGEIVGYLSTQLTRYRVPPDRIQVEVTESAVMADVARARVTITQIAALGVAVALDDFGTGYSSLQHLRTLPLAEIKIDKSFVAGMAQRADDAAIVASTVDLAHALGMRTVAEGVEDDNTARLLADIGCDLAQGWHTGRPMPGVAVPAWLADHTLPVPVPGQRTVAQPTILTRSQGS